MDLVKVKPPILPLAKVRSKFSDNLHFDPQNSGGSEFSHAVASLFLPPSCSLAGTLSRPSLAPLRSFFLVFPLSV